MSKLIKTALIAGLIVLPLSAHAAGKMSKIDTSGDGVVTFAEFSAAADARFAAADADANGFVTKEERRAAQKAMRGEKRAKKFASTDSNSDGALTEAEIEAKMAERKAKMEARRAERGDKAGKRKERGEKAGKRGGKKGKRADRVNPDTDGDGQISLAEHATIVQAQFTKLDANADGVLSADEMPKKRGKRGKRGGKRDGK